MLMGETRSYHVSEFWLLQQRRPNETGHERRAAENEPPKKISIRRLKNDVQPVSGPRNGEIFMNTKTNNSRFPFFEQIDQGINQIVNDLFQQDAVAGYSVPVNGWELNDSYVLQFDLPGVPLADIELQIQEGMLEVSGQRHATAVEGARVTLDEQPTGKFQRRLRLAKGVNVSEVDAELNAGVLTVTLRKMAQATPQKVQIRTRDVQPDTNTSAPTDSNGDSETDS